MRKSQGHFEERMQDFTKLHNTKSRQLHLIHCRLVIDSGFFFSSAEPVLGHNNFSIIYESPVCLMCRSKMKSLQAHFRWNGIKWKNSMALRIKCIFMSFSAASKIFPPSQKRFAAPSALCLHSRTIWNFDAQYLLYRIRFNCCIFGLILFLCCNHFEQCTNELEINNFMGFEKLREVLLIKCEFQWWSIFCARFQCC